MDLRKVKKLIELLEDSALLELEITEGDSTIRLSRASSSREPQQPQHFVHAQPAVDQNSAVGRDVEPELESITETGQVVESPMVGTFYDGPSPEAGPYVSVGSTVSAGDTLCIIEAMKTFNQLESDVTGRVKAIYKNSGDPVEFGEALFLIE